eukprot:scaffold98_cov307-Prasinococcus_capsulatus_cf.AAC.14
MDPTAAPARPPERRIFALGGCTCARGSLAQALSPPLPWRPPRRASFSGRARDWLGRRSSGACKSGREGGCYNHRWSPDGRVTMLPGVLGSDILWRDSLALGRPQSEGLGRVTRAGEARTRGEGRRRGPGLPSVCGRFCLPPSTFTYGALPRGPGFENRPPRFERRRAPLWAGARAAAARDLPSIDRRRRRRAGGGKGGARGTRAAGCWAARARAAPGRGVRHGRGAPRTPRRPGAAPPSPVTLRGLHVMPTLQDVLGPKVWEVQELKRRPQREVARAMLERIAKQVQPIMRKRGWRVCKLSEFYPRSANLLGLNVNAGQEVKLRLRKPNNDKAFFPYEFCLGTMLHELVHNAIGPHNRQFYAMLDELRDECTLLMHKGITGTGQGFDGPSMVSHLCAKCITQTARKLIPTRSLSGAPWRPWPRGRARSSHAHGAAGRARGGGKARSPTGNAAGFSS